MDDFHGRSLTMLVRKSCCFVWTRLERGAIIKNGLILADAH